MVTLSRSITSLLPSWAKRNGCPLVVTWAVISTRLGRTMGRVVRVCGAMGVSAITPESGARRGPPAAREYAVEPVGVATMRPSAQ